MRHELLSFKCLSAQVDVSVITRLLHLGCLPTPTPTPVCTAFGVPRVPSCPDFLDCGDFIPGVQGFCAKMGTPAVTKTALLFAQMPKGQTCGREPYGQWLRLTEGVRKGPPGFLKASENLGAAICLHEMVHTCAHAWAAICLRETVHACAHAWAAIALSDSEQHNGG